MNKTPTGPAAKDALAEQAVAGVTGGMIVGLGTGRTPSRAIEALARRVREEKLAVQCVCTTDAVEVTARELGLTVVPFAPIERLDYLIDGADEVDPQLRMLKGQHGAIGRQRLAARASRHRVYLVNDTKMVSRLGVQHSLPIAVMRWGLASIRAEIRNVGLTGVVRRNLDGELFLTPHGNLVLDVMLPERNLEELATALDSVPGVLDHGLFLTEADEVLVECKSGKVNRRVRER